MVYQNLLQTVLLPSPLNQKNTTVQVLEITIDFVYNLAGVEVIWDQFLLSFGPPVCVDRIDSSPGLSIKELGMYIWVIKKI